MMWVGARVRSGCPWVSTDRVAVPCAAVDCNCSGRATRQVLKLLRRRGCRYLLIHRCW